jgi:hypothetical protein
MKTCGCPFDTLGSLLVTPLADRAWMSLGAGAQSEAGLAEPSLHVKCSPVKLLCSRRGARER